MHAPQAASLIGEVPAGPECGSAAVRQLLLLAPSPHVFPDGFHRIYVDSLLHNDFLSQMQRLRGSVYAEDQAIRRSDLDHLGRHVMPVDQDSFHLLALSETDQVVGCCRFNAHQPNIPFERLGVAQAPIVRDPILGLPFRQAVTSHLDAARKRGYLYVEVGGWALHPVLRHSTEAVRLALLNFSLGLALGGAVGICTATTRNHSADILRRIGGRPLNFQGFTLPQYFDIRYGCPIEVMTFDSDLIPGRYASRIHQLREALQRTPVLCFQSSIGTDLCRMLDSLQAVALPRLDPVLADARL